MDSQSRHARGQWSPANLHQSRVQSSQEAVWSLQDSGVTQLLEGSVSKQTTPCWALVAPSQKNNSSSCASRLAEDFIHKFSSLLWKRITLQCQSHIGVWGRVTAELNNFKNNWGENCFLLSCCLSIGMGRLGRRKLTFQMLLVVAQKLPERWDLELLSCFESCEFQFSYNTRLRWTEEEFLQLSNHRTFWHFFKILT